MPIYEWNNTLKKPKVFDWWIERIKNALKIYDYVRIDHFRGLQSYWSIPVDQDFIPLKPIDGQWIEAPYVFFYQFFFDFHIKKRCFSIEVMNFFKKFKMN